MKSHRSRARRARMIVQLVFLGIIALIAINHTLEKSGNALPLIGTPSLHAVCPFGGVVSIYQFASGGGLVRKIHESSMVLMFIVLGLSVVFGGVFCGWVCPMGTVQEWISRLGKKIFGKRHNHFVPEQFDRFLRYLRYVVLGWVIYVTARSGQLIFADYDPYFALFNFWSGEVALSALIILGLVVVLSLFVERPFCKYACPYGAFLGVFNLFRVFGIKRNAATCINCDACNKACPMNIPVATSTVVRNHQCITCLECTSEAACPVDTTVELTPGRFNIKKVEV